MAGDSGDGGTGGRARRAGAHDRLELVATVLLAVASVLTAWSAFQAAKWSGIQSIRFTEAVELRAESTRWSTMDGQDFLLDASLWVEWVDAHHDGREATAEFLAERFEDPFAAAFDEWVAAEPFDRPDAPSSPFEVPGYEDEVFVEATAFAELADDAFEQGRTANQRSDNYVLTTVLLAMVLFFSGISGKFSAVRAQILCVVVAGSVLVASTAVLLTYPVEL